MFLEDISAMGNANIFVQDLNLGHCVYFAHTYTYIYEYDTML